MTEVLLTAVAAGLALTQPVPQIVRVVRTGSVAGVSGPTAWLGLVVNAAWAAYGVAQELVPLAVLSVAYVAGYAAIIVLLVRGGNRRGAGIGAVAAASAALLVAGPGWTVLGTALALTVGAQFVPQVVTAWRASDLTGLSAGTYVVCGIDGLVWGGYGALRADGPLVLYGVVMVSAAVLILVPQRRWARAHASRISSADIAHRRVAASSSHVARASSSPAGRASTK